MHVEGFAHLVQDDARQARHLAAVVGVARQAVDEQRELIAREPAQHRVLRQRARQSLGQHFQHAIAGGVAEGVVHFLEAIHVEVQQRHARARPRGARDGLLQQVLELHAIGDLGQRVVAGQVADAPLGALALGDVARHVDVARELRIVGRDLRAGERHRNGLAAARQHHCLARVLRLRRLVDREGGAFVFGNDELSTCR